MALWDVESLKDALYLEGLPDNLVASANEAADAMVVRHLGVHPEGQLLTWKWQTFFRGEAAVNFPQEIDELIQVRWDDEVLTPDAYRYARGRLERYFNIPWWWTVEVDVRLPTSSDERKHAILQIARILIQHQGIASQTIGNIAGNTRIAYTSQQNEIGQILRRITPDWLHAAAILPHSESITGQTVLVADRVYTGVGSVNLGVASVWPDVPAIPAYSGAQTVWYAQQDGRPQPTFIGFGSTTTFNQLAYFTKQENVVSADGAVYDAWVSNFPLMVSDSPLTVRR